MDRFRTAALALVLIAAPNANPPAAGQTPPPPGTSASEIQRRVDAMGVRQRLVERIRTSGLSPEQIRQRLASMGYDPSTLDPYLDGSSAEAPEPTSNVLSAVDALGLLEAAEPDSVAVVVRAAPDSTALERERGLRVFGLDVFRRSTAQFQPVTSGPVPPDYMIGPGDELILFLTGDVEQSYRLPVARDGFVVIPQVGQIWVNGLTLDEVRDQLYMHLGRAYSGVRRGPEATTRFQLSLGQLRPNQVFVAGQVEEPGTFLVHAVASALNALYLAGGPTPTGSFRDVRIMRGGRMVERLDLYSYLIEGDNLSDIRLDPGDVLFVPVHLNQVSIDGEVNRPAIYELLPGENLADLVVFAGGLNAPAYLRRARITRILPPAERTVPGVDRVTLDVNLADVLENPAAALALEPGDEVEILPVRSEVRNTVTAEGALWHPGTYRYEPGMRAWDLIERAEGLTDEAYVGRAHILRTDARDSTVAVVPFSLETGANGSPLENPVLREFDALRVFAESRYTTEFPVTIAGEVRTPLTLPYEEGLTLRDLILRADGLEPTADLTLEVARLPGPGDRDGRRVAKIMQVTVDSSYLVSEQTQRFYFGFQTGEPAAEFQLQPYDRVTVRQIPEFELQRFVDIRGEVRQPGSFTLATRDERLSSVMERAGGLRSTAYPAGTRFFREGTQVNIDVPTALREPGTAADIVLLPGDSVYVPEYNPVVVVRGAINNAAAVAVLFQEGAGLEYYIESAGGYARGADTDRVHVRYANGESRVTRSFLMFDQKPRPLPGSVVTVPLIPEAERIDWQRALTDAAQVAGTLTTLLLILARF